MYKCIYNSSRKRRVYQDREGNPHSKLHSNVNLPRQDFSIRARDLRTFHEIPVDTEGLTKLRSQVTCQRWAVDEGQAVDLAVLTVLPLSTLGGFGWVFGGSKSVITARLFAQQLELEICASFNL